MTNLNFHHFEPFELTAADYAFPMFYAGCALSFRLKSPEMGVPIFQEAVERVAAHLPFLKGIVKPSADKDGVMEVCPLPSDEPLCIVRRLPGLRLLSKPGLASVNQIYDGDITYDRDESLIVLPLEVATSTVHHPVIRFQINVLADGIIFSLFANHMVLDGAGLGTITEMLASCCRAAHDADPVPELVGAIDREAHMRAMLATIGRKEPVAAQPETNAAETAVPDGHEEVHDTTLVDFNFRLSAENIQRIHEKVHELGIASVSKDDVVTAALWSCMSRFRSHATTGEKGDSTCTLLRMINVRGRFQPTVSANYLGNCYIMIEETQSTAELRGGGALPTTEENLARLIGPVAGLLRSRLNRVDEKYIRDHLAQFTRAGDWAHTKIHEPDVAVTSLRGLQAYRQDFGAVLGEIEDFEALPYMNPDGVCTIKPCRAADHAWEVGVTLNRKDMASLREDEVFRWLVESESYLRIFEPVQ